MSREGRDSDTVTALRLEPDTRSIGRRVEDLIAQPVFRCGSDADRNGDARCRSAVRFRKRMAPDSSAQSLRDIAGSAGGGAQQRDQLVSTRVRDQLALTQVRSCEIEDGLECLFGIGIAELVYEASVVVDVRDE
jgi:hypothetical protein